MAQVARGNLHTFTLSDCKEFARLSADVNPMHLDALVARRLVAGRVVVHGSNVLLTCINVLASTHQADIARISCDFVNPVCVGDTVQFTVEERPGEFRVVASVDGVTCATVRLTRGSTATGARAPSGGPLLPAAVAPATRPVEEWVGKQARIALPDPAITSAFPDATRLVGATTVRGIAGASYVVGMLCPGLNSIASSYRVDAAGPTSIDELGFTVERFDPRFQLVTIKLSGAVTGEAKAFVRPVPAAQPSIAALGERVTPGEFAGTRSLVIGATRGIGEATAKLIAAGGGDVVLTWADGRDDASRVASDILAVGRDCQVVQFRAGTDDPAELLRTTGPVDHAYFFATPRIFRKSGGLFDRARFDEFMDVYAGPFAQLAHALDEQKRPAGVRLFHPSSIAVVDRPRGVTEYAMAKMAVELLAEDLRRALPRVRIIEERLPRIATDQTATVFDVPAADASDVMLPILRRMHAR